MDSERWREIEKLYESVVERSRSERAALLAEADPNTEQKSKFSLHNLLVSCPRNK